MHEHAAAGQHGHGHAIPASGAHWHGNAHYATHYAVAAARATADAAANTTTGTAANTAATTAAAVCRDGDAIPVQWSNDAAAFSMERAWECPWGANSDG